MNHLNHFDYDVRNLGATNSLLVCGTLIHILGTPKTSKKSSLKFSIYKILFLAGFVFNNTPLFLYKKYNHIYACVFKFLKYTFRKKQLKMFQHF